MANTSCGRQNHKDCEEWVHLDIKPDNVFLAHKESWDKDCYPFYATARLGDFGAAACVGFNDPWNPNAYKAMGTPNYRALEHEYFFANNPDYGQDKDNFNEAKRRYRWLKHKENDHVTPPLGAYTNVWGVGAVIFELMTLKQVSHYLYTTPDTKKDGEEALPKLIREKLIYYSNGRYTEPLVNLVSDCLKSNPMNRPTVTKLVEHTWEGRMSDFDDLQKLDEGSPQFDKYLILFDNLDDMENMDDWEPSEGQLYGGAQTLHPEITTVFVKKEEDSINAAQNPNEGQGPAEGMAKGTSTEDPQEINDADSGDEEWDDRDEEDTGIGRPRIPSPLESSDDDEDDYEGNEEEVQEEVEGDGV
ncbi:MAG: hypothetical protein Q9218_005368 [Villophora microphyllina]